jgi:DNA-binding PadR family transcriptional regulator
MPTKPVRDLELSILLAVAQLQADAYSLRIREQVSTLRRHDYSVGAIHTALQRLEDKQLVESWMTAPLPKRGGRSRRQYQLTAVGKRALRDAQQSAARLWADVDLTGKPA